MKFSHSIQFNAVPEWSSKYIAYTTLKKLIYSLQRDSLRRNYTHVDADENADLEENAHLVGEHYSSTAHLDDNDSNPVRVFEAALNAELKKIDSFYKQQEQFLFRSIDDLVYDIEVFEQEIAENLEHVGNKKFKPRHDRIRRFSTTSNDNYITNTTDPDTEFTQGEGDDDLDDDEGVDIHEENYIEELERDRVLGSQQPRGRQVKRAASTPVVPQGGSTNDGGELHRTKSIDDYLRSPKSQQLWNELTNMTTTDNRLPPQLLLLTESRIILRKRTIGLYTTLSELKSYIELNQTGFKKALKKFDKSLNTNIKESYLESLPENSYIFKKSTMQKVNERLESLIKLYALICNHGDDLETARQELSIHLREHVVWERNTVWRDMIGLERKTYAANSKLLDRAEGATSDKETDLKASGGSLSSFNISIGNPVLVKLVIIATITIILLNISPFDDVAQKNCFAMLVCASLLWATEADRKSVV